MDIKTINTQMSVCGQVELGDVAEIKKLGYVALINNRPDYEVEQQPTNDQIRQAAQEAGLDYYFLPVGREGLSPKTLVQTCDILAQAAGPVLAFCRTGTRSTTVWALSQAGKSSAQEIIDQARIAGYDISHLQPHLETAQP